MMPWFCPEHGKQEKVFQLAEEAKEAFLWFRGEDKFLVEGDVYFPQGEMILAHGQPLAVLNEKVSIFLSSRARG